MTNKQGILIGALGSYFNELIAENLRPIVERIDSVAAFTRMTNELLNGDIEKRISTLDQRINELLNGDIEERISTLDQRLDELEKRLAKLEEKLDADFAWGRQAIHKIEELSELEKGASLLRKGDRTCDHSARVRGIAQEEIRKHLDSDQFRRRIFDIVDMALQQATLSIKGSE